MRATPAARYARRLHVVRGVVLVAGVRESAARFTRFADLRDNQVAAFVVEPTGIPTGRSRSPASVPPASPNPSPVPSSRPAALRWPPPRPPTALPARRLAR